MLLTDVNNYPIWIRRPETAHIQSWIGAPLMAGNEVLGFFSVDKADPGFFTEEHLRLTEMLAAQTAVAIQNVQLFQEATRRAAELESIIYTSAVLRIAQTVEDILPAVLKIAIGIVDGVEGDAFLIEPESGALVSRGCYPPNDSFNGRRHALGEGITGHVAATGQLYIAEDLANDPLVYILPEETERVQGLGSNIGLPLHAQDRVVGVLHISLGVKRPFTPNEIRLLTAIAEIAGSALDRALLLETLEQRIAARTYDLAEANEQLKELDRLKTKFVSDVSHELRTPITNLNLYLDLIERGSPDKRDKYLTVLREQTARLKNLIEDTMSLARLDMGKGIIKFTPVNLNNIVEQVAAAHLPRIEMADLTLTLALQFDLPLLMGERNQLAQVATNLLGNAINYTPQGQIVLKTYLLPDEEFICLEIKDSGIGIDTEDQIHLFERFYRGRETGQSNIPGTGLGLAIVKEIIDLHKGVITVDSQPGQGTAVCVHLPITQTPK
jgi:signal transduction histidine kinase